jgi:hypothetical protein
MLKVEKLPKLFLENRSVDETKLVEIGKIRHYN